MSHAVQNDLRLNEGAGVAAAGKDQSSGNPIDWQKLCNELVMERDKLREELAKAKQESDQYKKAVLALTRKDFEIDEQAEVEKIKSERDEYLGYLYALTHKEFDFDKEEILAGVGKRKPLRQFIAELERKQRG